MDLGYYAKVVFAGVSFIAPTIDNRPGGARSTSHGRRPTHVERTYGSKNAIGYRDIVGTHIEEEEVTKIVGDRGRPISSSVSSSI